MNAIGVRTVLFVVLILVSVAPAVFLVTLVNRPLLERELEAVHERHYLIAQNLVGALKRYAKDVQAVLRAAATMLADDTDDRYFGELLKALNFQHVCLVDNAGNLVAAVTPAESVRPQRLPSTVLASLGVLSAVGEIQFSPVVGGVDGVPLIHLGMRVSPDRLIVAAINTDYFVKLQASISFGERGHAALVDQAGRVLAHPNPRWGLEMKDMSGIEPVERMMAGESGVTRFVSPALDTEMVAGYATVPGPGWGAMVPQPLSELEASVEATSSVVAYIVLVGGLGAMIIGWWLSGYLTRPVTAVTEAARRLASEAHTDPVVLGRTAPHELHSLASSFNTMVRNLIGVRDRLRVSELRFRSFAETAADWFWETDADLQIVFLSDRFQAASGMAADEVLGRRLPDVVRSRAAPGASGEACAARVHDHQPFVDFELTWVDMQGERRYQHVNGVPVHGDDGVFHGYRGTGRDVTVARQLSEGLSYLARHDDLTGLKNRREFEKQLADTIEPLKSDGQHHALCFVDVDRFKRVNDSAGHVAGDELLRQVGRLLSSQTREGDVTGRLGGDEFGVLLRNCALSEAVTVAQGLRDKVMAMSFAWDGNLFNVSVSIGVTGLDADTFDLAAALQEADAACYMAKNGGRNRVYVFRQDDAERARRQSEMQWIRELEIALDEDRIILHCQPLFSVAEPARAMGCEILLRLAMTDGTLVRAGAFLPAAERYEIITGLDRLVVQRTLGLLAGQDRDGSRPLLYCINISGRSLNDESFLEFLIEQADNRLTEHQHVCFEITETVAIANLPMLTEVISRLRARGFQFALDDFGCGLSSLAYLKSLPVDYVKIDGTFIRNIAQDPVDRAMVSAINDLGHLLGKRTIAEYVENTETMGVLRDLGIDLVQGRYFGEELPLEQFLSELAIQGDGRGEARRGSP